MDFANAKRENVAMGKKVMIVEDNEFNLKLFTDLLRAHQFEVQGCAMDGWRLIKPTYLPPTLSLWTFNCSMSVAPT